MKPNIELVCAEKDNVVKRASKTEAVQVERVTEKLNEEWNKLIKYYDDRHK